MRKSRIGIVILFMSIALLGIIFVQVYWINNAIDQKEKVFDYQVNDALNRVTDKLEKNLISKMINGNQFSMPENTDWNNEDSAIYSFEGDQDSVITSALNDSIITKVIRHKKRGNTYYEESELSITTYGRQGINDPVHTVADRPTFYLEPFEYHGGINFDYTSPENDLIPQLLKNIDKQVQLNAAQFNEVMQQMILQMIDAGLSAEDKVDKIFLEKTLHHELENKGITTSFNYAVLVNNEHLLSNVSLQKAQDEIFSSKHKVTLFPSTFNANSDLLLIDFPNQKSYFLSSIWSLLLGSLIFTAIIIIGFTYTVSIVFKQKKLSEIKTDFINNMTHEFKTPIATISLAVDAINNPIILQDESRIKHYTHIIKEENKRMNGQVEKVLQMALLDKNQINLSEDEIDMHDIIGRAVDNIRLLVDEKKGVIHANLNAEDFELVADEVHMVNVIYNLLDNANKYSPVKPEISISTYSNNMGLYISIQDKGLGMSLENQKMIFEKFYRVPTGNVHNIKGFGLGLTYVKAIIDAHKGTIEVKSQLNKGSEFKIFLPFTK